MKPKKLTPCSSAQDLNADEMKQVAENANQTHNKDADSKSGTGTTGPGEPLTPEKERELQAKACEGKKQYDSCSWSAGGINHTGTCNYSHGDKTYYCSNIPTTGVGSGTGGLSARETACLNKMPGDPCDFVGDDNKIITGTCRRDHWSTSAQPLFCSQSIGSKQDENKQ